jgi:hypothetical protein
MTNRLTAEEIRQRTEGFEGRSLATYDSGLLVSRLKALEALTERPLRRVDRLRGWVSDRFSGRLQVAEGERFKLPSWLCIGVPKSGTTSLYRWLVHHPEVWMPRSKETQFFSSVNYGKGLQWYVDEYLKKADPGARAIGELSPKYMIHRAVPWRVRRSLGSQVKLVLILRNPVNRAWSHYCHSYKIFRAVPFRPTEDSSFEEALMEEASRLSRPGEYGFNHPMWNAYFFTGMYIRHIQQWLKVFRKENFLFLILEDFAARPQEVCEKLCQFLGIGTIEPPGGFEKANSYARPGLNPVTRAILLERYRPYTEELERFLGRDLPHWKV